MGIPKRPCQDAVTVPNFDILLMVKSNIAAFDNEREKFDLTARKIEGTSDQQRSTATRRLESREVMGNKPMREITLK